MSSPGVFKEGDRVVIRDPKHAWFAHSGVVEGPPEEHGWPVSLDKGPEVYCATDQLRKAER